MKDVKDEVRQVISGLDNALENMDKYPDLFQPSDYHRRYKNAVNEIRKVIE